MKLESKEGFVILSKKWADYEEGLAILEEVFTEKKVVNCRVINAVKGGLIVHLCGHKGFLPASHLVKEKGADLEQFVSLAIPVVVIDFDKRRKKIILSNKLAKEDGKEANLRQKILASLEAGMVVKGKVSSVKSFGVFIDLGGIEGLIHISELSWCRVNRPEDILTVGQEVDVFVLGVDKEEQKVSLGYKQLFPDPWVTVEETYKSGEIVEGKVSRIVDFGVFIELQRGIEGLVHISEVADRGISHMSELVSEGELIKVKILRVLAGEKKIGLTLKLDAEVPDTEAEVAMTESTQEDYFGLAKYDISE